MQYNPVKACSRIQDAHAWCGYILLVWCLFLSFFWIFDWLIGPVTNSICCWTVVLVDPIQTVTADFWLKQTSFLHTVIMWMFLLGVFCTIPRISNFMYYLLSLNFWTNFFWLIFCHWVFCVLLHFLHLSVSVCFSQLLSLSQVLLLGLSSH